MKDFINVNVEDTKELSVRDAHLAVIDNLPKGFERVDFDNPESILYYGHDDKQAISDILTNTAGLSIKQGKQALSEDMIAKLYTFEDELEESDRKSSKKELAIVARGKSLLTKLGVKKFEREKEQNSYGARYQAYCDNIEAVCNYMEEQMQESLNDIKLRQQIAYEMKPYMEHLKLTIQAGEADYYLYLEEIEQMKKLPNAAELENEIKKKEMIASVFNGKLDKLRKVYVSYEQHLLVYAEQQNNEMNIVMEQQSYIEDQQPILRAQGSSMIFNRQQAKRASDLEKLNEATNKAYSENALAITKNADSVANLMVNGGLKIESVQALQSALEYGIQVFRNAQQEKAARIASDQAVIDGVLATSEEYDKELQSINEMLEGLNGTRGRHRGNVYAKRYKN